MKTMSAFVLLGLLMASPQALAQDPTAPPPASDPAAMVPATSPVAVAPLGAGFGLPGQLVISDDTFVQLYNQHNIGGSSGSGTSFAMVLGADYFLRQNLSLGAFIGFNRPGEGEWGFSLGGRAGYNIPLATSVSFWPRLQLALARTTVDIGGTSQSTNVLNLAVYAPVLFHIVEHFFVGIGPVFDVNVVHTDADDKPWEIGITSTIGGYLPL